jgi:hypothetical protein
VLYGRSDQLLEVQDEIILRRNDGESGYMENVAVITDDVCNEMLGLDGEWLDLYKEFDGIIHQLYSQRKSVIQRKSNFDALLAFWHEVQGEYFQRVLPK